MKIQSNRSRIAIKTLFTVAVCITLFGTSRLAPLLARQADSSHESHPSASEMAKRFRAMMPDPLAVDDHAGFASIFDGNSLKGWDGDPTFWRAESGAIVGETTADKKLKLNTFLIWRGGKPKDFELKVEYRINNTNSGVQYRSVELPDVGKWVLKGYQADIDAENMFTGQVYEERGRGFLALRGQFTHIADGKKPRVEGSLGDGEQLKGLIKNGDWNQLHVIARGNVLVQVLNGHVMSQLIDDDTGKRMMEGLLGFQLHMGPPMKVEFRNIWLKNLSAT
jgi:3-keto-disaccharide hydrolase